MGAMDARRLELYELLKPKLDEEPARQLVLALPADPENLATKDDLRSLEERFNARLDGRLEPLEARLDGRLESLEARLDGRLESLDARLDGRLESLEARLDARFAKMENLLTRRMVTILGAWTIMVGSTVGWVTALLG